MVIYIKKRDTGGEIAQGLLSGFLQGRKERKEQQSDSLARMKTMAEVEKLNRENEMYQKLSEGGVSTVPGRIFDPISMKTVADPNFLNPSQQSTMEKNQMEMEALRNTEANKERQAIDAARDQLNAIRKAREGKEFFGYWGDRKTDPFIIGGKGKYDQRTEWEANIQKLLAGRVLETMTNLKNASKTGATGFGNLTEKEMKVLQDASTVLSRQMSPDVADQYLAQLEPIYQKVLDGAGQFTLPTNSASNATLPKNAGGVPSWVPKEYERDYSEAKKRNASDEQIMHLMKDRGIL